MKRLSLVCYFLLAPVPAFSQTVTGNLDGRVTDPGGAVIPGVHIAAHSAALGIDRTSETNASGYFEMPFLPIDTYDLTVSMPGFATLVAKGNVVSLNKTTTLNLSLQVSSVQESVTVNEAAQLIDVTTGQIRRSIDDTMVSELPVAGRDFRNLAAIFPGFQSNPTNGQNNYTLSSGSTVSFNGTGTRGTSFMTDGIANDDYSENQNRQQVKVETIKELQIVTNNFAAEFGRGYGAVVLVSTKSGTNQTHGDGYWFYTNTALDARSYFSNAAGSHLTSAGNSVPNVRKASGKTDRLGGTLGGALKKDKLFYFGSYEHYFAPGSTLVTTYLLPTQYLTPDVNPSLPNAAADAAFIKNIAARFPANLTPNDPAISPYAWQGPEPRALHTDDYSGRVDYRQSDNDFMYVRYQYSTYYNGLLQEPVKGENVLSNHNFQNVGLTWTHIFSPSTTGEFRAGFGRRHIDISFLDPSDTPPIMRWSLAGFSNILGNASSYPTLRVQNDFQYVYNLSTQLGSKNTLKFGTDIRRTQLNDLEENYNRGFWTFSSANGLNAFQNFQQGIVQSFTQGFGPDYIGERITEMNFYGQDDVRLTRGLTLNLGFRVERVGAPSEVNNLIPADYKSTAYIDPRFGFAYSPDFSSGFLHALTGGAGNSVVRGGFGIFHGRIFEAVYSQIGASSRFNPPNAATLNFSNPNEEVADPGSGYVFAPGPPRSQVSLTYSDPNLHMPYTEQWNLTLERQLPWNASFDASYVGNRGIGLLFYNWGNRAQFPVVSSQPSNYGGAAQGVFTGVPFNQIDPNLFDSNPPPGQISLTQGRTNARRTDGNYSAFLIVSNAAWSYYNALQLAYTQKAFKGLNLQANYTWSKNIDTGSEATNVGTGDTNAAISQTQGMASLRGLSRLAQPQRLVLSYVYDIPLYRGQKGIPGRVLGGWQVSGNTTFASGNPFTVLLGYDLNGDGIGGDRPFIGDPSILGRSVSNARIDPATGVQFAQEVLPLAAFSPTAAQAAAKQWPWYPGSGIVGNLGRNTFWAAGQNNWDFALIKDVRLFGERPHLQFRAEMYNLMNRVQFDLPAFVSVVDTTVPGYQLNPNLGKITNQRNSPRNMEMMLKFTF
ncbi:MAG: carboxypeptidase regulatory-like domain-containing protein [Bryobacteraceae bacterium]